MADPRWRRDRRGGIGGKAALRRTLTTSQKPQSCFLLRDTCCVYTAVGAPAKEEGSPVLQHLQSARDEVLHVREGLIAGWLGWLQLFVRVSL